MDFSKLQTTEFKKLCFLIKNDLTKDQEKLFTHASLNTVWSSFLCSRTGEHLERLASDMSLMVNDLNVIVSQCPFLEFVVEISHTYLTDGISDPHECQYEWDDCERVQGVICAISVYQGQIWIDKEMSSINSYIETFNKRKLQHKIKLIS